MKYCDVCLISNMISNCLRAKLVHSRVISSFSCAIHTSTICTKDHYKTLQVESSASAEEIKEAYLNLSKLYHPDVNEDEGAKRMFQKLTEAYEVVGNEKGRQEYDNKFVTKFRKMRQKKANTRKKDHDNRSYEEIHEKIKKVYKNDEELFKEWARRDEENTRKFFEEHMFGEKEDERRERERRSKERREREEFLYNAMDDEKKREIEANEIRYMKLFSKILVIGLIGAFILEKL